MHMCTTRTHTHPLSLVCVSGSHIYRTSVPCTVCMYVRMHACIWASWHYALQIFSCINIRVYACIYVPMHVFMYGRSGLLTWLCNTQIVREVIHVCTAACIHTHTSVHTCMYIRRCIWEFLVPLHTCMAKLDSYAHTCILGSHIYTSILHCMSASELHTAGTCMHVSMSDSFSMDIDVDKCTPNPASWLRTVLMWADQNGYNSIFVSLQCDPAPAKAWWTRDSTDLAMSSSPTAATSPFFPSNPTFA